MERWSTAELAQVKSYAHLMKEGKCSQNFACSTLRRTLPGRSWEAIRSQLKRCAAEIREGELVEAEQAV